MKIEEGKYYRSREEKKVGPMRRSAWMSGSWADHTGYLYDEDGRRHSYIGNHLGDLISEWKEEEPAMDYATMNEFMDYLQELRELKRSEYARLADAYKDEDKKIGDLMDRLMAYYPVPKDEDEK